MPRPHVVAEPADDQADPLQVRRLDHQLIQRHLDIRPPLGVVDVLRPALRQPLAPHHGFGRQTELPRSGDQTHPLQPVLQPALDPHRPTKHLERQLRRPIAERPQRQVLEHHIGRAAKRRGRPFHRLDQRVRRLRLRPPMHPHRHPGQVQRLTVGPDPADPVDRPLAQPHGEAQRVFVLDRLLPALAARPLVLGLQEPRGPDHLPHHPRPAKDAAHRRPVRRRLQAQAFQPRPLLPRRRQAGDHPIVDGLADGRADELADRPADLLAHIAQYDLRQILSPPSSPASETPRPAFAATTAPSSSRPPPAPNRRGSSSIPARHPTTGWRSA
ncbi:hypothetical protein D3C72_775720 [compost metagenome]